MTKQMVGIAVIVLCGWFTTDALGQRHAKIQPKLAFSGIYPHLAVFNSSGECGIGALVKWQGRLWAVTYAPHAPNGSDDKLYEIDSRLNMVARPESIGGTPANRMIHRESEQLMIGSYFIDKDRCVRVLGHDKLPGRTTATARHLTDPANKVYVLTMEEGMYEVDVHTLAVKELFRDGNLLRGKGHDAPWLPGCHGKGGYTGQGRVVYSNNGECRASRQPTSTAPAGCLAEYNGNTWHVVRRAPFTEVTGPGGITGNPDENDPLWATGWDRRSVILMVLAGGQWHSFRLPKGSHCYDARHGWFTEWPRIRTLDHTRLLMTMHGTMFQFPRTFSARKCGGIRPLSTYLKMVVDWEQFAGKLVFACDDASKMANKLCGQSQSNFWFVAPSQLGHFGPRAGCGGPWLNDRVRQTVASTPYLFAGYDRRMVHLSHDASRPVTFSFEVDKRGDGNWSKLVQVEVPAHGYRAYVFHAADAGQWIRVTTDTDCRATAYFHYTANPRTTNPHATGGASASAVRHVDTASRAARQHQQNWARSDSDVFTALAKDADSRSYGLIRPRGNHLGTLHFAAWRDTAGTKTEEVGYYEIGPDMRLRRVNNAQAHAWLKDKAKIAKPDYVIDAASVLVIDKQKRRWRLPNSLTGPDRKHRQVREVVTERRLLNCAGTFYELPYDAAGGMAKIKPICTHQRQIYDFCSWRGMMVISGCRLPAASEGHYVAATDGNVGLWFGTVDDLWRFPLPRGVGGPWHNTSVKAGVVSDPYLMYGYDRKMLALRHDADQQVMVTAEVDVTGSGDWYVYRRFAVAPAQTTRFLFPEGFSARWIRLTADTACRITATFTYGPAKKIVAAN